MICGPFLFEGPCFIYLFVCLFYYLFVFCHYIVVNGLRFFFSLFPFLRFLFLFSFLFLLFSVLFCILFYFVPSDLLSLFVSRSSSYYPFLFFCFLLLFIILYSYSLFRVTSF